MRSSFTGKLVCIHALVMEEGTVMPANQMSIIEQIAAYSWLEALGSIISAIGDSKALSKRKKVQEEGENLVILGNILQAIATAVLAGLTLEQGRNAKNKRAVGFNAFGSFLQTVGNSIQALTTKDS